MGIKVTYNLYEIRERKGYTIRDLSSLSGVSKSQINNIENGTKDATVTTICMLADALGKDPRELYQYKKL